MKSFQIFKITSEHAGLTVEQYLRQVLQYSGRNIQRLTRQKGVILNSKTAFLQKKIKPNDTLRISVLPDTSYGVQPEQGFIEILYEDDYMLVINKPAGQLVHPAGHTTAGTLANHLAFDLQQRGILNTIRPIHRLDRDTSGCIIFAKNANSQFILEQQLKTNVLKRTYWALVAGKVFPPCGIIDAPIGAHPTRSNRRAVSSQGESAVTHYRTVSNFLESSLLELTLDTGRTHQIRIHLAYLGYPIIGDTMYGIRSPLISRQCLHAYSVCFRHVRDDSEISVYAPLPADFSSVIASSTEE